MKKTHKKSVKAMAALLAASLLATAQVGTVFAEENTEAPGVEADASIDAQEKWVTGNAFVPFVGAGYVLTYTTNGSNATITGYDIPALRNLIGEALWANVDINGQTFVDYIDTTANIIRVPNAGNGVTPVATRIGYRTADNRPTLLGGIEGAAGTVMDKIVYDYNGIPVVFERVDATDFTGTTFETGTVSDLDGYGNGTTDGATGWYVAYTTDNTGAFTQLVCSLDRDKTAGLPGVVGSQVRVAPLFVRSNIVNDIDREAYTYQMSATLQVSAVTAAPAEAPAAPAANAPVTVPWTLNETIPVADRIVATPVVDYRNGRNPAFELVIPEKFIGVDGNTYTVTAIDNEAFSTPNPAITAVRPQPYLNNWWLWSDSFRIPSTVTTIGNAAFYNCVNLRVATDGTSLANMTIGLTDLRFSAMQIPASVTSIGSYAFFGCIGFVDLDVTYTGFGGTAADTTLVNDSVIAYVIPQQNLAIGTAALEIDQNQLLYDHTRLDARWLIGDKYAKYDCGASDGIMSGPAYARANGFRWAFSNSLFTDIAVGDWKYAPVQYVISNNLMAARGQSEVDGDLFFTFDPETPVTRREVAETIYAMAVADGNGVYNPAAARRFDDVPSTAYWKPAIDFMTARGFCVGKEDNFGVDDPVTREELATMLFNYARDVRQAKATASSDNWKNTLLGFKDVNDISYWAEKGLGWSAWRGIITGKDNGKVIAYSDNTTRGEFAAMVRTFHVNRNN